MRVKAGPDAAVARLHASTRRPDIGGTVPYDSSLLRHCARCREQHNGANYKNILQHSLSSSFWLNTRQPSRILSDYVPTTLCQWSRCQWRRCQWSPLCRLRVACRAVRGVLRGALHAVPSRSSGPQHLTLSAPWLALRSQTRPLLPKSRSARNQFRFEFFSHVFNLTWRCFCL